MKYNLLYIDSKITPIIHLQRADEDRPFEAGDRVEFYLFGDPVLYVYKTVNYQRIHQWWGGTEPLADKLQLAGVWSSQDFSKEVK